MPVSVAKHCDNMIFMSCYPDKSFDIAIVDPQTGQGEDRKHLSRNQPTEQRNGTKKKVQVYKYSTNIWDLMPPNQAYFNELFRVSKRQIIMCENWLTFDQKEKSSGRIVWNLLRETDFSDCNIMWTNLFNRIDYFEFMWNGMHQGIEINNRKFNGNKALNQKRIHPSEKPYKVYSHLLKSYVKPGSSILDTHMGSGALRIVADKMGYDFYGCEQDEQFFYDQEKRWNNYKLNLFS